MPYLTANALRDATSNLELAQVASPRDRRPITAEQMRKAIDGEPLTGEPSVDRPAIDAALARVNLAVTDSSGVADNYLRSRYTLPLASPPSALKEAVIRVARYLLHNERAPKEIAERYREAIGWFEDVAKGIVVLDVPAASATNPDAAQVCPGSGLYTVQGLADFAGWR